MLRNTRVRLPHTVVLTGEVLRPYTQIKAKPSNNSKPYICTIYRTYCNG